MREPQKIPGFFRSWGFYRKFKKQDPNEKAIVFYSESGQDWHHLSPLIHDLTKRLGKTVCYVSSDPNDPGLHQENKNLRPFYIREGMVQILFFQFLKVDVLVLTMLDLNHFQLKRSIHPVHYIYVFHAMGSTHMVDLEDSYDHYDTVFCAGPHQKEEIRKREELKKLPPKHLFDHGYARLEQLIEKNRAYADSHEDNENPTILLAPTWGDTSILNTCGLKLVETLLNAGFNLILRPHYQTLKRTPQVVKAILGRFGDHDRFEYIDRMGETDSLFKSDLLICDWSSMSMEYALGLEKPVLFIDVPKRVRNPNYEDLGLEPLEIAIRKEVGKILDPLMIETAPDLIRQLLSDPDAFKNRIKTLREKIVFNLGKSAQTGAEEIVRISENFKEKKRGASA
ncbi:MAG: CDP-glycerol glycerophosphotransferase family protein [Proteobacteria bacterium]|nr:CDP-glycerol glycerophosphotransferase family protein [Pseudomonadota bacterium]